MAKDPMSSFEISADMRRIAETSVAQAKQAFEGFMTAAQQAVSRMESQTAAAHAGASNASRKAIAFASHSMVASFAFAQKLAQARDVDEVMRLQADFLRSQMQTYAEQARELGASFTQTASNATRGEP